MIVAFRVDSSSFIGSGHVMRCLSLAKELRRRNAECIFVCRALQGNLAPVITKNGFKLVLLPVDNRQPNASQWLQTSLQQDAEETRNALDSYSVDWLVVDHYGIDFRWEEQLRGTCSKLFVIDDLADRRHDCDLLLDQNVLNKVEDYKKLVPPHCRILTGPLYALLDQSYVDFSEKTETRQGMVRRILIYFGGGEYSRLIEQTLDALIETGYEVDVDLVTGQCAETLEPTFKRENVTIHSRLPTLAPLMAEADLAIGASGTSNWERCCLGLPSLVVTVAENQEKIAEELARLGVVVNLGRADLLDQQDLVAALKKQLTRQLDSSWSQRCRTLVDGYGVHRIAEYMLVGRDTPLRLRNANAGDEALLLQWSNDPLTRQMSLTSRQITQIEHHQWFSHRLSNPDIYIILVAETDTGLPVGQMRFEWHENSWEISFNLDPLCRGKDMGKRVFQMAIDMFYERQPGALLRGVVKVENLASRAICKQLGFIEDEPSDYIVKVTKHAP